jgi:hypothetical protein
MKGYNILEELYESIGHRTIACTLVLENGHELTGTHCIDMIDLVNEESWKQKAFHAAYHKYLEMKNAVDRQVLFDYLPERSEYLVK